MNRPEAVIMASPQTIIRLEQMVQTVAVMGEIADDAFLEADSVENIEYRKAEANQQIANQLFDDGRTLEDAYDLAKKVRHIRLGGAIVFYETRIPSPKVSV